MNMEHCWNDTDRKTEELKEKNLAQNQFVHHKSHMDCPRIEPGFHGRRPEPTI
jgi:hypothetical protein